MMEIQADLEARMASLGVDRFRRNALEAREAGEATRSKSMQTVLDVVIDPTAAAILKFRDEAGSGRAGRRHSAVRFFSGLEAEALAFITAKFILDGYAQDQNLTRLAVRIGSTVELEKRLAKFAVDNAQNFKGTLGFLDDNTGHLEHRRRVLMHMLREHGDDWDPWSDRDKLLTGLKLIELMVSATGLLEFGSEKHGKKTVKFLKPTQRWTTWWPCSNESRRVIGRVSSSETFHARFHCHRHCRRRRVHLRPDRHVGARSGPDRCAHRPRCRLHSLPHVLG
nr:hypothetical protein [Mesorhizobium sp.]